MSYTICMISCLHPLQDDRIYWKEALSLNKYGYKVIHLGVSDNIIDYKTKDSIRIISIKRKTYYSNPFIDKLYRILTFKKSIYSSLFSIAAGLKADVYHIHDYQLNRIVKKLKRLTHSPEIIYDVHEPYPEIQKYLVTNRKRLKLFYDFLSKRIDNIHKRNARYLDRIITTESNVAGYFKTFYPDNKIYIIYNYADTTTANENISMDKKEYDAIYIGGISKWRGIFEMLSVTKLAKENKCRLKILFLGNVKEARLKKNILNYIKKHELGEYIRLQESVPHKKVPFYLSKSKIGICLFKDNPVYHMIMPIKIFEYMAFGLPVLCNDFGHPGRIIKEKQCGISLKKTDPDTILNALLKMLNDKKTYIRMSKNGKAAVRSIYNWKFAEKRLIHMYNKLLT